MNSPNPVPAYFSLRYIAWLGWTQAVTVLSILQAAFAALMLAEDPTSTNPLIPHNWYRWIVLGNAILTAVIAQIKRDSPPPTKAP